MSDYWGYSHSFDVGIAIAHGKNAAIVFNHIVYWLTINASKKDKEKNLREGKIWMYESQQEIADFLKYMSLDEVKKAIVKLLEVGLLIKGSFNSNPFDKTAWYTTADQSIIQNNLTKEPYGSIDKAPRLDPQSPTAPSHYIQKEHIHKEKQQQRACEAAPKGPTETAAASFQKQTFPTARTRTTGIYDFLGGVDIPDVDKRELTSRYDRNTVQNAIAWATHPQTKLTKGLVQALKWACQNKPEVPRNAKDEVAENKAYAKRFDGVKVGSATVSVLNQCVEIEYGTPYKPTTALSYEEKGFKEQLDSALRKIGYGGIGKMGS